MVWVNFRGLKENFLKIIIEDDENKFSPGNLHELSAHILVIVEIECNSNNLHKTTTHFHYSHTKSSILRIKFYIKWIQDIELTKKFNFYPFDSRHKCLK